MELEAEWPTEPKTFSIWLFTEKVFQSLLQNIRTSIDIFISPRKAGNLFFPYPCPHHPCPQDVTLSSLVKAVKKGKIRELEMSRMTILGRIEYYRITRL